MNHIFKVIFVNLVLLTLVSVSSLQSFADNTKDDEQENFSTSDTTSVGVETIFTEDGIGGGVHLKYEGYKKDKDPQDIPVGFGANDKWFSFADLNLRVGKVGDTNHINVSARGVVRRCDDQNGYYHVCHRPKLDDPFISYGIEYDQSKYQRTGKFLLGIGKVNRRKGQIAGSTRLEVGAGYGTVRGLDNNDAEVGGGLLVSAALMSQFPINDWMSAGGKAMAYANFNPSIYDIGNKDEDELIGAAPWGLELDGNVGIKLPKKFRINASAVYRHVGYDLYRQSEFLNSESPNAERSVSGSEKIVNIGVERTF